MKTRSLLTCVSSLTAAAGLLAFAPTASASGAAPNGLLGQISIHFGAAAPQPQPMRWDDNRQRELRHVFWELEHADRDYDGHRTEAVHEIRRAADSMGMDLHGEGYGAGDHHEGQHWSDHQLREARDQLADLAAHSGGHERDHLDRAVHELDRALGTH